MTMNGLDNSIAYNLIHKRKGDDAILWDTVVEGNREERKAVAWR
jgi:hypothetical protein